MSAFSLVVSRTVTGRDHQIGFEGIVFFIALMYHPLFPRGKLCDWVESVWMWGCSVSPEVPDTWQALSMCLLNEWMRRVAIQWPPLFQKLLCHKSTRISSFRNEEILICPQLVTILGGFSGKGLSNPYWYVKSPLCLRWSHLALRQTVVSCRFSHT